MESRNLTEKFKHLIVLPNWMVLYLERLQERILKRWSNSKILKPIAEWVNRNGKDLLGGEVTVEQLLYIPNIMCYFRVMIIPLYLLWWAMGASKWFYLFTYVILMTLDLFDGPVARQVNTISPLGEQTDTRSPLGNAIDPFSDKVCHLSMALAAVLFGIAPWWLFANLLAKEILLMASSSHYKTTGAKIYGKVGTAVEVVVLSLAFIIPLPLWVFIALVALHWAIYIAYKITD